MGFGTIAATIIMFIAVMSLSTTVYVAMKNDISEQSTAMREQGQFLSNSLKTDLSMENVGYDNNTNTTIASIRNTGKTKLSLDLTDLYIDLDFIPRSDQNRTIEIDASTDSKNVGIWDPNEIVNIEIFKDLEEGDHTLKVSVQYGVNVEDTFSVSYP